MANGPGTILCREHLPLLRGQGRYLDDFNPPNAVHVAFVRSPYAHARLRSIEIEAALQYPGVLTIVTGRELRSLINPIRPLLQGDTFRATNWYPLAWDKVRYVGEAVAAVVAVDRYRAEDAAERVQVGYEPLPAITSPASTL